MKRKAPRIEEYDEEIPDEKDCSSDEYE